MHSLFQDLRYGIRLLSRYPGFTAIAVLTLALGIGANATLFSVVNGVLLRPLPYRQPDRLVAIWERVGAQGDKWRVAPANYLAWKEQSVHFETMAAIGGASLTLTGVGEPEQLLGNRVSAGFFKVIGVEPFLGRSFLPEEVEPGKGNVVILGAGLWQERFASDPSVLGKTIILDSSNYTIVGVMPRLIYPGWPTTPGKLAFDSAHQQFWLPMSFNAEWSANRRSHVLGVVGRLSQGATLAQVRAEMDLLSHRLKQDHPESRGDGVVVNLLMDEVVGNVRPALLILLCGVGLVLLIACSNVASLMLAQLAGRQREIAIRAALGAGRWRLARQFLLEGLLLSLLGGLAAIGLAVGGIPLLIRIVPQDLPRLNEVTVDASIFEFALILALFSSLVFALVPALQASKTDLQAALKAGAGSGGQGHGRQQFRNVLVVFQVSMAVVLLVCSGLLAKSFLHLRQVNPGFDPHNVLVLKPSLSSAKYRQWFQVNNYYNELLEQVKSIPGVQSAAVAYDQPLESNWLDGFTVESHPPPQPGDAPSAEFHPVSWEYFQTVGIDMIAGRQFTRFDDTAHPGAVIINQAFARRYLPGEDAVGKRLRITTPSGIWPNVAPISFEIVGVVRDVKSGGLNSEAGPAFYISDQQIPLSDMTLLVRTKSDPLALVTAVRNAIWGLDADQPVGQITTMEKLMAEGIAQPRFNTLMMALFGAMSMILAIVGIYGLLSYVVTQRRRELGVRMALGARPWDVFELVLRQGLGLTLTGLGFGLIGAFVLTRFLANLLFGVSTVDPLTFLAVAVLLPAVALLASFVPARRATRVDPIEAIRYE